METQKSCYVPKAIPSESWESNPSLLSIDPSLSLVDHSYKTHVNEVDVLTKPKGLGHFQKKQFIDPWQSHSNSASFFLMVINKQKA